MQLDVNTPCEFIFIEGGSTAIAYFKCCTDVPVIQGLSAAQISQLKIINLGNNALSTIASGTFSDLGGFSNLTNDANIAYPKIESISLLKNKIQRFYPGSFDGTENSLKILDLQYNKIEDLERVIPYLPTTLQKLYLDENIYIQNIPTKIFQIFQDMEVLSITAVDAVGKPARRLTIEPDALFGMKKLKVVHLSGMGIRSIPVDTFSHQTRLERIYLRNNRISSLNPQLFKNLQNLTHLSVSGNELTSFPMINCGDRCLSLQTLDVSSNAITNVPILVTTFPNLRSFDARANRISDVEDLCFENMTSLGHIDIPEKAITDKPQLCKICPKIFSSFSFAGIRLTTLKHFVLEAIINYASTIDLSRFSQMTILQSLSAFPLNAHTITATEGSIQKIDSSFFTNMRNLQNFSMTVNDLTETPPFGLHCPSLHTINLCKNRIISVNNETFLYLPSLTTLILCENLITHIPEYIRLPASLEVLDLTNNLIKSLGSIVKNLKNLTNLIVTKNRIEQVPFNTLANLSALQHLAMDENLIEFINESDGCCPSLRVLKLNENYMSSIPVTFLLGVPELRKVSLQGNKLVSLPEIGNNARHLSYVDISQNNLGSLPMNIFKDTSLRTLKMNDNKIDTLPNLQSVNDTLRYINGSNNLITTLDGDANVFKQFGRLVIIDLSMNEISITPPEHLVFGMD